MPIPPTLKSWPKAPPWKGARMLVLALACCVAPLAAVSSAQAASSLTGSVGEILPYDVQSPWNTPIGPDPGIAFGSFGLVSAITDNNLPLTSDVDQYAIPVYYSDDQTPLRTIKLNGYFSSYDAGDNSRVGYGFAPTISGIPIPASALSSAGSDGQIVIWNPTTGVEYAFWQFAVDGAGNYTATNGVRYHTTAGYYGRFGDGKAGRGAATPYFAGLVRPWEIARGRIDHALAFAYNSPSPSSVYPAGKSDGVGVLGTDLPEGSRLQLDPTLTDADFTAWGLAPEAKIIAKALQTYGMYVIDNSGSSKIYLEDRITAKWGPNIDRHLTEKIPLSRFRVVVQQPPSPPGTASASQDCGPEVTAGAPDQRAQTRAVLAQITRVLRPTTARRLRTRSGLRLSLDMPSGSMVHTRITRRVDGRTRLLARGRAEAGCGRVEVRMRPTSTGRRELRRGRLVSVRLRLRVPGSTAPTSMVYSLRLGR